MPQSPGSLSQTTDDGLNDDIFIDAVSGEDGALKNKAKGLLTRSCEVDSGKSLIMALESSKNPKESMMSLLSTLKMWTKLNPNRADNIEYNSITVPLMRLLCTGFLEFMYHVENTNEMRSDKRRYDEDEFISKFCENDDFSFLEKLRDNKHPDAQKLLLYIQNDRLNYIRNQDSGSANRFLKARSEVIHAFRVFEYGTLMYYISELNDFKKAFDYIIWYFRNSTMSVSPDFLDILMLILDGLITHNFNQVINAMEYITPGSYGQDIVTLSSDIQNPIDQYFSMKKNQSVACVKRLIISNKMLRYPIKDELLNRILSTLTDELSCVGDLIAQYKSNDTIYILDNAKLLENTKTKLLEKWNASWESGISASLLDHHTSIDDKISESLGGASATSTTNYVSSAVVKYNEWPGILPECEILDKLRGIEEESRFEGDTNTNNPTRGGWAKDTASDPIHVMRSMHHAIEALNSNYADSKRYAFESVIEREATYKENIKISRMRRQNEQREQDAPPTFVSPADILRTVQPQRPNASTIRTEHPTQDGNTNKRRK